jgi:hypothetical protein
MDNERVTREIDPIDPLANSEKPSSKRSRQKRLRVFFVNICLMALTVIVCLALGEIIVRIVRPSPNYGFQKGMVVGDDYTEYRPTPNYSGWYREREYASFLETNSEGWRGTKEYSPAPPKAGRIILVGDSFTQALMSQEDKTVAGLLRARYSDIGRDVVNAGTGGYSPIQELHRAEQTKPYSPSLIIWMVWVGNDFTDIVRNPVIVRDGDIFSKNPKIIHFTIWQRAKMKILAFLYRHSQLWNLTLDTIKYNPKLTLLDHIPVLMDIRLAAHYRGDELLAIYKKSAFEPLTVAWDEKVGQTLAHLRATMPGVQVVSVIIPTSDQVDPKVWDLVKSAHPGIEEDMKYAAQGWLADWMKKEHVPSIDLTKTLIDGNKTAPTFFFVDGHWNDYGESLAAEEIGRFIDSNLMPL